MADNLTSSNEIIHIACAPDNNYAQHCGVMLASLFENNPTNSLHIHILHSNLTNQNKRKIETVLEKYKAGYNFYKVERSHFAFAPVTHHISEATYYRFALPLLISESVSKLLYLDVDLIVRKDILPLWNTDLRGDYYVAAVCEVASEAHLRKIGLNESAKYFNAGVLLVNLRMWRVKNVFSRAIEFIQKNSARIVFWDQDVMNVLFENKWFHLNYTWNVNHYFYTPAYSSKDFGLEEQEYFTLRSNPSILHFSGHVKPWDYSANHPMKNEYYKYIRLTPWRKFKGFGAPTKLQVLKEYITIRLTRIRKTLIS